MLNYLDRAQRNEIAKRWAQWALFFDLVALVNLFMVRELNLSHRSPSPSQSPSPSPSPSLSSKEWKFHMGYYWTISILLVVLHLCILRIVLYIRRHRWIRVAVPSPFMVALACVVSNYVPLGCTAEGSLTDEKIDHFSLVCIIFFTLDFFCLQMAILPAYDYLIVHMCLGIGSTVVLSLAGRTTLRFLWLIVAGCVTLVYLTLHHWLTVPAPISFAGEHVYDMRLGDDADEPAGDVRAGRFADDYTLEIARALLRRWCNDRDFIVAQLVGLEALILVILVTVGGIGDSFTR